MRALFVVVSMLCVVACQCGGQPCSASNPCAGAAVCVNGTCVTKSADAGLDAGAADAGATFDAGAEDDAGVDAGVCREGAACDGGVCLAGACCQASKACGDVCCGASARCFASRCVVPGQTCRTTADCAAQETCEPGLGDSMGAVDAGPLCAALPVPGRCVALPPRCADGGVADGGDLCVSACEFRPPVGQLDAVVAWSWGQPTAPLLYPEAIDVWSTPVVGRFRDGNCDGLVDELDPPNLIFVSAKSVDVNTAKGTCCHCTGATSSACRSGVLRVLDGRTGLEVLTVEKPSPTSTGWSGISMALADVDGDRAMDLIAVTGEGFVVIVDKQGRVVRTSDLPIPNVSIGAGFGWGGGLSVADLNGDGAPEILYGATIFSTSNGQLKRTFVGAQGQGESAALATEVTTALSTAADVDPSDLDLELVAGTTVYRLDGGIVWNRSDLGDGFPAVADFNLDGDPEVALVSNGRVFVLDGRTGATRAGPLALPGGGGGPPTVADFDGTRGVEIGVAQANFYSVVDFDPVDAGFRVLWSTPNHDLSSNVTGSTVFDFEGDGVAEVLYQDECYVWVFDGPTGRVRFAGLTTSFTGTESSIVADLDGDGHAELVSIANGADPGPNGWGCDMAPWNSVDVDAGRPAWRPPTVVPPAPAYRGIKVYRDSARSWVGTRSIWNQHTYHVTNVCLARENLCVAPRWDGQVPRREPKNWRTPGLDNFRQNVQLEGLFSAPDAVVSIITRCGPPVSLEASVQNLGEATLPAGVVVGFFLGPPGAGEQQLAQRTTTGALFPGGAETLSVPLQASMTSGSFFARILVDPQRPTFRECRANNNESRVVSPACIE